MRRFLNNLFRDFRTTSTSRGSRTAPRRATLQVEALEDRLVMSSATSLGSPLLVNTMPASSSAALTRPVVQLTELATTKAYTPIITGVYITFGQPGVIDIRSDGAGNTDVYELGQPLIHFPTSSVKTVNIFMESVNSASTVYLDDSNGMPFAPGATVDLNGTGLNFLNLYGSRAINGDETYVAGGAPWTPGTIFLANVTFTLHSGITDVYDSIPITGNFDVQTSGTSVQLNSYGPGSSQSLGGMGVGGGDSLYYSNKPTVTLETYAPNAGIFLDAPDAAVGESYFTVCMNAAGETTTIDSTPKNVWTVVNVNPPAANASVSLWGNFGPVIIDGDSTTGVSIGYPLNSTGVVTRGIEANVTVEGASYMVVNDSGNVSTFENVTVTEHTISGSGLFGNNSVTLEYGGISGIDILTGQLADGYTVAPSYPNAVFTGSISIFSDSYMAFHVNVSVNSASHLNLSLFNEHPQDEAVLDVNSNGFVEFPDTLPNGTIDVLFAGLATSQISYNGFAIVD